MDGFARACCRVVLSLVLLLGGGVVQVIAAEADGVGRVLVTAGGVQARGSSGALRPLAPDDRVQLGDTLITDAAGRTQIRFIDGGLVSLRPDSEYRIDEFSVTPGAERQIATLRRGALRTLTGLAASRGPDRYRLDTPLAVIGVRGTDFEVATTPTGEQVVGVNDGAIRATATRGDAASLARVELGVGDAYRYALFRPDGSVQLLDIRPAVLDLMARVGPKDRGSERERRAGREGANNGGSAGRERIGLDGARGPDAREPAGRSPPPSGLIPGGSPGERAGANRPGAPGYGGAAPVGPPRLSELERGDTTLDTLFSRIAASTVLGVVANATAASAVAPAVHGGVTIVDRDGRPAFTFAGDRRGFGGQGPANTAVLFRGRADVVAVSRDVGGIANLDFGVFAESGNGPAIVQRGLDQALVPQTGTDVLWVLGAAPVLPDLTVSARFDIVDGRAVGNVNGAAVVSNQVSGGFTAQLNLGNGSITAGDLAVQFARPGGTTTFAADLSGEVVRGTVNFSLANATLTPPSGAPIALQGGASGFFVHRGEGFAGAFDLHSAAGDSASGVFAAAP